MLGSPALRPVSWHVWAGEVEKEEKKKQCTTHREDAGPDLAGVNPFASLESRIGFWDIRVSGRCISYLAGRVTIAHLSVGKEKGV